MGVEMGRRLRNVREFGEALKAVAVAQKEEATQQQQQQQQEEEEAAAETEASSP